MKHCTSKRSTIVLALIKKLRFLMSANMYSLATASNARLLSSECMTSRRPHVDTYAEPDRMRESIDRETLTLGRPHAVALRSL
jgi:hypothetical protein